MFARELQFAKEHTEKGHNVGCDKWWQVESVSVAHRTLVVLKGNLSIYLSCVDIALV